LRIILLITAILMIAAITLTPALGFTNQAEGNQSYTAISGARINYSLEFGVPAHDLTPDMVANKYSFKSIGIVSTKMPYSFNQEAATPYSFKLSGVENAVALGMKIKKPIAKLGSISKAEPVVTPVAPFEPPSSPEPQAQKIDPTRVQGG